MLDAFGTADKLNAAEAIHSAGEQDVKALTDHFILLAAIITGAVPPVIWLAQPRIMVVIKTAVLRYQQGSALEGSNCN